MTLNSDMNRMCISLLLMMIVTLSSTFRVEIEPGRDECFYLEAEAGWNLEVDFNVLSTTQGELDVDFHMFDPSNKQLISDHRKTSSHHRYPVGSSGHYRLCFGNSFSHFSKKTVSFSMVVRRGKVDSLWRRYNVHELLPEDNQHLGIQDMHERTDKVRILLNSVSVMQEEFRHAETRDRSLAEHNFERVNFWSVIYLVILLLVGMLQVILVKGFFDEKYALGRAIAYLFGSAQTTKF